MRSRNVAARASVAIAVSLAITACTGGPGGQAGSAAPVIDLGGRYELKADTPAWQLDTKKELTELTWYVNADWWNDTWGQDVVTKKMQEDLKIKVKFLKGDDTKLNTMFASGELPDIVTILDANSKVATSANTWAWSLDQLSAAVDPYWNTVAAKDTLSWYRLADGHVYGYPDYSNTQADYDSGAIPGATAFLIRKDVYQGIGQPPMATQAEFLSAMGAIAKKYPDLTPLGFNAIGTGVGSLGDALQDYLGVPLQNADGSFYDRNLDADYLSWIGTLRQAHEAGYIPDDAFADDGTVFEEKIKTGRYATIFLNGLAQMGGAMQTWLTAHPDSEYIAVQGPASTVGNKPTLNQSGITGWMVNYISKKAKDPVKAMQVFTYLQSEYGQMLTTFGIEGETFTWTPDRKVLLLPDAAKMKSDDNERFKQEYRLQEFIFFGHDRYKALSDPSMLVKATVQPMEWGAKYLVPHFILERADPASGTVEARNLTAINAQWSTTLVSMIRGSQADEQTTLQAYKDFLAANGWDAIVKVRTENMAQARKLFGIN